MTAATFDTLAATRNLESAGIERQHAEAIAGAMREAADAAAASADRADLATKADLADFATKADLAELRAATRADLYREIGALRSEMRWMFGFQSALILAMAAKLFGIV